MLGALARERHFVRAASACNVTQPTLSPGIKQLEESMNILIVERRQRFVGFTPEGERVLAWAQRVLADYGGLIQELSELRDGLAGQIQIGAIPVSLPSLALLTEPFSTIHSRTRYQIISHNSAEIQRSASRWSSRSSFRPWGWLPRIASPLRPSPAHCSSSRSASICPARLSDESRSSEL